MQLELQLSGCVMLATGRLWASSKGMGSQHTSDQVVLVGTGGIGWHWPTMAGSWKFPIGST
eukprot:5214454-Pleurochrysis_carterae.AAC.1